MKSTIKMGTAIFTIVAAVGLFAAVNYLPVISAKCVEGTHELVHPVGPDKNKNPIPVLCVPDSAPDTIW